MPFTNGLNFWSNEIDQVLGLVPIDSIYLNSQMDVANCTWASLKAALGGLFYLMLKDQTPEHAEEIATILLNDFVRTLKADVLREYLEDLQSPTNSKKADFLLLNEVATKVAPSKASYGNELHETVGTLLTELCKEGASKF